MRFEDMVRSFDFSGGYFNEYEMQRIEAAYSDLSSYDQMRAEVFLRGYPDVHYYLFDY